MTPLVLFVSLYFLACKLIFYSEQVRTKEISVKSSIKDDYSKAINLQ